MSADRLLTRRELLVGLAAGSTATATGCTGIPSLDGHDPIRLQTIWLFNADPSRWYTFNVRLRDGDSLVFEDVYDIPPMDDNQVAGQVEIASRLPEPPGKYVLEAWTDAAPDRRGEVPIYKQTGAASAVIDVSVTGTRDFPAIFIREDSE